MVKQSYQSYNEEDIEKALMALAQNGGNVSKTAREMGLSRTTLQGWKDRNHDEFVSLRQAQRAKAIEKAYAPLISNLEHAVSNGAIKEQTSKECSEAALNFQKLITNLSDEPVEPIQHIHQIDGHIDIRAVTDRTEARLQLLDQLSSRGRAGIDIPSIPEGAGGTSEVSDGSDTKLFVYHEQGEPEAASMVEQDTEEAVSGN